MGLCYQEAQQSGGRAMLRLMTAAMTLALALLYGGCSYLNFESTSQAAAAGGDDS